MSRTTLGSLSIAFGIIIILLGTTPVHRKIIVPLQEKGYLPPPPKRQNEYEIISGMGPRLTLYTIGLFFILLGLFLLRSG